MILTVTPNPSLDTTIELPGPLTPGEVHRAVRSFSDPGGKGVNISRALAAAGEQTLALLPGDPNEALLAALSAQGLQHRTVPVGAPLRTNITITDPAGTTTKINEPGPVFTDATTTALASLVLACSPTSSWVALAGSLPPGAPADFYATLIRELRQRHSSQGARIAVDASGAALAHAIAAEPDLIKPNAEELIELHRHHCGPAATAGLSGAALENDHQLAAELVRSMQHLGLRAALVTLGARGALFVPDDADAEQPLLLAYGPPVAARSTVGAGDAALAGFLIAHQRGQSPADCLRQATAQGRAAAYLPGSAMPGPADLSLADVVVEDLHTTMKGNAS